jgi:hypothetical protein
VQVPPLPEIPEPLRGRAIVVIDGAYVGDEADGAEVLAPLRALGPDIDTFAMIGPAELLAMHMDPPGPVPATGDGALLDVMPGEAIDAVDAHVDVVKAAVAEWDAGRRYLNFTERPIDTRCAYSAAAYRRLQAVKTLVDPDDVFRGPTTRSRRSTELARGAEPSTTAAPATQPAPPPCRRRRCA